MKKRKLKVGIIGTGNIGTDLLMKIQNSDILECSVFSGQNLDSKGIKLAKSMGINTSFESIKIIERKPSICDIVFDATSAHSHFQHAPILKKLGKFTIDMTPSRIGQMCIPIINLEECLDKDNISMITCGGQATTPIIKAVMNVHPEIKYIEIVSSISSKSAGIGTRNNIDEYTESTAEAIKIFTGVPNAKAIVILNPAEPPILMHNTIYIKIDNPNLNLLSKEIKKIVKKIKEYVPGYKLTLGPIYENNRLTIMNQVIGQGDYLPAYAGNLDIINCAAISVAEAYARRKLLEN